MDPEFRFDFIKAHTGDVISFYGNIDSHAEQHFERLIQQISAQRVVMDFNNTGRINSMGIAILLRTINCIKAEKSASVEFVGENKLTSIQFKMTGLYMLIDNKS